MCAIMGGREEAGPPVVDQGGATMNGTNGISALALGGLLLAVAAPEPAGAQTGMGPRTMSNVGVRGLDAGSIGDQQAISSSDDARAKLEVTRELQYLEPAAWKGTAVTWLRFEQNGDGEVLITEGGAGVVRGITGFSKWTVESLEGGGWKAVSEKGGGKVDLYVDTTYKGEDYRVGAVVPKFEGTAYGAIYRGVDFLFFVVQKKHSAEAEG
jgi:hypothetical protein